MLLTNWLNLANERGRYSISKSRRRNGHRGNHNGPVVAPAVESLEQRTYLSASAAVSQDLLFLPDGVDPSTVVGGNGEDATDGSGSPEDFVDSGFKWAQPGGLGSPITITYSYSNFFDGGMGSLTEAQLKAAIEESLGLWAANAPLNFVEVVDSGPPPADTPYAAGPGIPDIRIGHHFIDGAVGPNTLAHAFLPVGGGSTGLDGDVHFDNGNTWQIGGAGPGIDVLEVALHELGHSLGLGHEPTPPAGDDAIMNPFYGSRFTGLGTGFLLQDDIDGIQAIYGAGVGSVTPIGGGPGGPTDDHGDSAFDATPIQVNAASPTSGDIETEGDEDWFSFEAVLDTRYTFEVLPGTHPDPTLTLIDRNGVTPLAIFDTGNALQISWTANATGTFYLKVASAVSTQLGTYTVAANEAALGATPMFLSPGTSTTDATPLFEWTPVAGVSRYELWVTDLTGGGTAIHNTDINGTRYTDPNPLIAGHTYRAQVRGITSAGTAGQFSPTLDFTFQANDLTAPMLRSPIGSIATTTPSFLWTPVDGAAFYDLWVNDLTTNTEQVIRRTNISTISFLPTTPLTAGNRYVWTVRGIDSNGIPGEWGTHRVFTIGPAVGTPTPVPINNGGDTTPTFGWSAVAGAARYDLWVNDLTSGQSQVIRNMNIAGTSFTPATPLTNGHEYIWTVRAIDGGGTAGNWATHERFSILNIPGTPVLGQPAGLINTATPNFNWSGVATAVEYEIWVNNVTTGQKEVIRQKGIQGTNFTPTNALEDGNEFIWTVRAINAEGTPGAWGAHRRFTVGLILTAPVLSGPTGVTSNVLPEFRWNASPTATSYELFVTDLTNNGQQVLFESNIQGTSFQLLNPLTAGNSYRWWVRGVNAAGEVSDWSAPGTFSIAANLVGPALGEDDPADLDSTDDSEDGVAPIFDDSQNEGQLYAASDTLFADFETDAGISAVLYEESSEEARV